MSLEPGMYRDSLHTFDSPQFWGRLPHCLQRRYLSHCSCISMPGLWARRRSSSSCSCLRHTLAAQESSRERRASKRSWWRSAWSKMMLRKNNRHKSELPLQSRRIANVVSLDRWDLALILPGDMGLLTRDITNLFSVNTDNIEFILKMGNK